MPKISVVMPAYNAEKYIGEAIESILKQSYGDFEFIILNDCSQDGTEEIILSYDDERIVYVKNQENLGVARTLNKGLALAKGEYIARMDADDISLPQRLEKQTAFLDGNPEVAVLGTNVETFDETGALCTGWSATDPKQMHIDLLFSCGLAHPSVMMRRDVIAGLGGYDPAFEGLEDYELWCRVAQSHQVTTLPEVLFRYRVHSGQVTKNPSEKYLSRLRALKEKQLQWLGLPAEGDGAECYYSFCEGKRPAEIEDAKALCKFLENVIEANKVEPIYDVELLKANFHSIAVDTAARLRLQDALKLCRESKMVCLLQVIKRKLR